MAISKIIVDGVTKMDVTGNTNTAATILDGYIGTAADGTSITGTYSSAIQTYPNITGGSSTTLTIQGIYTSPSFFILQANYPSTSTTIPANRSDILYVYFNGTTATGGGIQTASLQNPAIISLTFSVSVGNGYLQITCGNSKYKFTHSQGYTLYCLY